MGKDDNLKIFLSINKLAELIHKVGQLIVTPGEGWWSDFTYRIRCSYFVYPDKEILSLF
jgi:hypothetical protein